MQCPVRRHFAAIATFTALLAATLSACGGGASGEDSGQGSLSVVATTTQIADLAKNVGGERIALSQVLKPGSDPHGFEPRPSDVAAAASATLVFSNGQDLDPWAARLISDSGSEAELVDLSAALPNPLDAERGHSAGQEQAHEGHGHDSDFDPHWWHDPRNSVVAVTAIADHLASVDPAGETTYRANATAYIQRIERLDGQIAACIDRLPRARRKLVTDHEAFGYFAHRYGLEVVGALVPALTSQAQASARDLSDLAATIRAEGVAAIFPEASLSPKLAETVADQTGVSVDHALYGDALGPADSDGGTYLEMMAANARTIVDGLSAGKVQCELDPNE